MPPVDPNQVLMTGENSFIRLSPDGGKTMSDRTSHWRVLWCPAGAGHVLFIQSTLTDGKVLDPHSKEVDAGVDRIVKAALKAKKIAGAFCATPERALDLQKRGYRFNTDNDSELIAVYLADKLKHGISLKEALRTSIDDLDGTFSFLVSTKDEIGYAKDRLAAKPMIKIENDDLIAIASEEVSLNRLFPGRALDTSEPAPGTYDTWQKST